jgi:hypothetical protein
LSDPTIDWEGVSDHADRFGEIVGVLYELLGDECELGFGRTLMLMLILILMLRLKSAYVSYSSNNLHQPLQARLAKVG